jgi:hypothetical protein
MTDTVDALSAEEFMSLKEVEPTLATSSAKMPKGTAGPTRSSSTATEAEQKAHYIAGFR